MEQNNLLRLSHTFFVLVILHIILIGGIFVFNYVKVRSIITPTATVSTGLTPCSSPPTQPSEISKGTTYKKQDRPTMVTLSLKETHSSAHQQSGSGSCGEELISSREEAKHASKERSNYKTYVVVEGDNPYSIARRLRISYSELLRLNNIREPTKVQTGAKLKIPADSK